MLDVANLDDSAVGSVWYGSSPLTKVVAQARWWLHAAGPLSVAASG
jgi:hypothetical protein